MDRATKATGVYAAYKLALYLIAADRLQVAGAHMDFPGFGTLTRNGTDFRFEPAG